MAYVGMNKADIESREYLTSASEGINALGTILNTSHEIGAAIYKSQVQDLQQRVSARLKDAENEIYSDPSIAPEQRDESLRGRYDAILQEESSAKHRLPGVMNEVRKNLEDRHTQVSDSWKAKDFQTMEATRQKIGYDTLDSYISSNNIQSTYENGGLIKGKGYTPQSTEESSEFSESFMGSRETGYDTSSKSTEKSVLFDPELHDAVHSGQHSEYDLRMMGIHKAAADLHPHNEELRQQTITEYEEKLRNALPLHDLEMVFAAEFDISNIDNWDYPTFRKEYEASLKVSTEYGGQPLSASVRQGLMGQLHKMWTGLQTQMQESADSFYNDTIRPQVMQLVVDQANNPNKLFFTEDVDAIFASAMEEHPELDRYLIAQKENALSLARTNENIRDTRRYKELSLLGNARTEVEQEEFINIEKILPPETIADLRSQALEQAEAMKKIDQVDATGLSFWERDDLYEKTLAEIEAGEYDSPIKLDTALGEIKESLTETQYNRLLGAGNSKIQRLGEYKSSNEKDAWNEFDRANIDGDITTEQANAIIEKYNLLEDAPHIAQSMLGEADKSFQKQLEKLGNIAEGYAEETDPEAFVIVKNFVKDFSEGKVSESQVLESLRENKGNLHKGDYTDAFNTFTNTSKMMQVEKDALFKEKVRDPFILEKSTITLGTSEQRLIEAGLDPMDFVNELNEMKDVEFLNQYRDDLDSYTKYQMYLGLKARHWDDESIAAIGLYVPDMSFQDTLEWKRNHPDSIPLTGVEHVKNLSKDVQKKLSGAELPSGKPLGAKETLEGVNDSIKKSLESIYKISLESAKVGAEFDNKDTINELESAKYAYDENEFKDLVHERFLQGQLTEKSYTEYLKVDIEEFKGPEYQRAREALAQFGKYIRDLAKTGVDKKGNVVRYDGLLPDALEQIFIDRAFSEYQLAVANSNGAPVNVNDVAERTYNAMNNQRYFEMHGNLMDTLTSDTTVMGNKAFLFWDKETSSYKEFNDFSKGQMLFVDLDKMSRRLFDPEGGGQSLGVDSGLLGTWLTMSRNGASEREIADEIAREMAIMVGITPPPADKNFRKNFEKLIQELPPVARSSWEQASLVAKWTVDIYRLGERELDPKMIQALSPTGDMAPFMQGNRFGLDIGGKKLYFDSNGKKENSYFYYIDEDNNQRIISGTQSQMRQAEKALQSAIRNDTGFSQREDLAKSGLLKVGAYGKDPAEAIENYLNMRIEQNAQSSQIVKKTAEYASALNQQAMERSMLTGVEESLIHRIEQYVEIDEIRKSIEDGTINTRPLSSFIGFRQIPAVQM